MSLNLRLVKASQFLQQFKLHICRKPRKEHIILNVLSHLGSTNVGPTDLNYSELDILVIYNVTFIKIYLILVLQILARYKANNY